MHNHLPKEIFSSQEQCLHFLNHTDANLRGSAAKSLGQMARDGKKIDREKVVKALRAHLNDEAISEPIKKALSDIHLFLSVAKGFEDLDIGYSLALTTFEEFLEDYPHTFCEETLKEINETEKHLPYTTTVKWMYVAMDDALPWCWQVFGPKDGLCVDSECCPLVLAYGREKVKAHSHQGTWTSIWLGKTDYDFGYEKFFFKYEAARDVFEKYFRGF